MKNLINNNRKNIGFALTVIVIGVAGWIVAWNQVAVQEAFGFLGNIGNDFIVLVGVIAFYLAIFWPKKFPVWLHRVYIAAIIILLVIGNATKLFGSAFAHFPWTIILVLVGALVVITVLHGITVLDHPIQTWKARFKRS